MRPVCRSLSCLLSFLLPLAPGHVLAQQTPDHRPAEVVSSGKLRVGVGLSLVGATKDSTSGELKGVAIDLARALAERLNVELTLVEYPSPPRVLDGLKSGAWDVGVFAIDPARFGEVDFTPAYLQVDSTFLVPATSKISTIAEADRAGVRIAVPRSSVEEILLRQMLKSAELRVEPTSASGLELLVSGQADALAATRPTLLQFSTRLPGSRVLQDRFGVIEVAMAVPKGHGVLLQYLVSFIEDAKSSGQVSRAIERAGLRGVQVAP